MPWLENDLACNGEKPEPLLFEGGAIASLAQKQETGKAVVDL